MKKDPNYIAAVEKAITEKYGKNTVQDFRNEWEEEKEKEYLKQLKDRSSTAGTKNKKYITVEDGSVQIKRPNKEKAADRTCPVCKTYSFSGGDDLYMNRFQCCYDCHVKYMPNQYYEKKWLDGWRPDNISAQDNPQRRK